jgi:hypothetical protein
MPGKGAKFIQAVVAMHCSAFSLGMVHKHGWAKGVPEIQVYIRNNDSSPVMTLATPSEVAVLP